MREVGTLVSNLFAEQQEARKKQVHLALTAPRSEPPPPIPEGLEPIIRSATGATGNSAYLTIDRERKRQAVWTMSAAVVAALFAVAGTFVFFAWRGSRVESATTTTSAAASTKLQLHLAALPAGATLALDGRALAENPAVLTVTADDREHELRATLAGHEPFVKIVRFERDLSLDIMLQATPGAAQSSSAAAQNVSEPPSSKGVSGRSAKGGVRTPAVAAPAKNPKANCNPPFYFENGIKVYKPECI
jgi:hypothetical protein